MKRDISDLTNVLYENIKPLINAILKMKSGKNKMKLIAYYWEIGHLISETEQKIKKYTKSTSSIITALSDKLTIEYGKGYSARNLIYYKQFFLSFPLSQSACRSLKNKSVEEKNQTICERLDLKPELSWSHYRRLAYVEDNAAKLFYIKESIEQAWSIKTLERQIRSCNYRRTPHTSENSGKTRKKKKQFNQYSVRDFIKDPFVMEFLKFPPQTPYTEKQLENALLNNIQKFILELGKGYAFVGRQQKIVTKNATFFIDLTFYNYILKCFVIIDLKIGKLTHQDIGQMDMYVRMFDDLKRRKGDNPTIGLILCSEKDETTVKYSSLSDDNQLFASQYLL